MGKTVVFLALINEILQEQPAARFMIVAHRKELIDQPAERLAQFWPERSHMVGIVMGNTDEPDAQIIIGTIQTLQIDRRLDAVLAHGAIDYLIIDETHHSSADGYLKVINRLQEVNPALLHLGVTATPVRADGDGLPYDVKSAHFGVRELVKDKYLAPPRWLAINTKIDIGQIAINYGNGGADFNQTQLKSVFETDRCYELVVETHQRYATGRKAIAFTVSVEGAVKLAEEFNKAGIPAASASGTTSKDDRKDILAAFRRGELEVLTNCLDSQTEILTERGWVGMDEIKGNDVSATYDPSAGTIQWEPIKRIVRRKRRPSERMVSINNQTLDIRVTEGHRMLVRSADRVNWKFVEAGTLPDRVGPYLLPLAGVGESEIVTVPPMPEQYTNVGRRSGTRYIFRQRGVPENILEDELDRHESERKNRRYKTPEELTVAECVFIGLFITDGHLANGQRGIEISSSDRYPDVQAEISDTLEQCGFDFSVSTVPTSTVAGNKHTDYDQKRYRIPIGSIGGQLNRRGYMELEPYLDKDFSPLLYALNRAQTVALLRGLWLGDGIKSKSRPSSGVTSWSICGANKTMFDRLQTLAVTRGFAANLSAPTENGPEATMPMYKMTIRDRRFVTTNNHTVKTSGGNPAEFEDGWKDEEVWCVTNETGTIVTRRNGKVAIMGQCALFTEGVDLPDISCIHQVRPTKSDGLYLQMVGRGLRLHPGKEDCLILDYAPADARNVVMLGDVLGVKVKKEAYIKESEDAEEGDALAGFTFDGEDFGWMGNSPMEIVSRQLDYLNLSPYTWQGEKGDWLYLGLGPGERDEIDRTLAISPPGDTMTLWGVFKRNEERWHSAMKLAEGTFEELSEIADGYIEKHGNQTLAMKQRGWRSQPPSDGQIKFATKLGIKIMGMTKGQVANAITQKLAFNALKRAGAISR